MVYKVPHLWKDLVQHVHFPFTSQTIKLLFSRYSCTHHSETRAAWRALGSVNSSLHHTQKVQCASSGSQAKSWCWYDPTGWTVPPALCFAPLSGLCLQDTYFWETLDSSVFSLEASWVVSCACAAHPPQAAEDRVLASQPSAMKLNGGIQLLNNIPEASSSTNNPLRFVSHTKARQVNHSSIPLHRTSPEGEYWGHMQLCIF